MATLAQLRTRVSSKLGLDNTAAGAEQTLVDSWINEGVVETLLALKCYVISATMSTTLNKADYQLDSAILDIKNIFVTDAASQSWSLEHVETGEILYMRRVTTATSAPPRFYSINGANLLMVYPTPSEIDVFTIYYVPRPTALSSAGDDPSSSTLGGIPLEFHKLIEWWALAEGADFLQDPRRQDYMKRFEMKVRDYRRSQLTASGRLPRKLPAMSSRTVIPPRNSIDIEGWM